MNKQRTELLGQTEFVDKEELKEEVQSFQKFAFQKNMIQLSIALILGTAFNDVVGAITKNLVMPIINAALSHTGTSWRDAVWQPAEDIAIEYGAFLGAFMDFLLTALILYIVFRKIIVPVWTKYIPQDENEKKPTPPPVPISLPSAKKTAI
jgi:large conductance mechanosensitive channel